MRSHMQVLPVSREITGAQSYGLLRADVTKLVCEITGRDTRGRNSADEIGRPCPVSRRLKDLRRKDLAVSKQHCLCPS